MLNEKRVDDILSSIKYFEYKRKKIEYVACRFSPSKGDIRDGADKEVLGKILPVYYFTDSENSIIEMDFKEATKLIPLVKILEIT